MDPESGGQETLGSISGEVFDNSNESSIQGATVELFTSDEELVGTSTTNSDGNYSFSELELGDYIVQAAAEGYSSASSDPVTLTEEGPDADVDIGLDPELIETQTELAPEESVLGSFSTQLFNADVNEVVGGGGVHGGTVRFTVTNGDNVNEVFDADLVEGQALMDVGCNNTFGQVMVPPGTFDVLAEFLGTSTHAGSSEPEPSTLTCNAPAE